jgi:hypothetical protein
LRRPRPAHSTHPITHFNYLPTLPQAPPPTATHKGKISMTDTIEKPVAKLRFVKRKIYENGVYSYSDIVLQQQYQITTVENSVITRQHLEWRDVPTEEET